MKIGVDLDNTILDYTLSVEVSAVEAIGLEIPTGLSKADQKSYIVDAAGEKGWTLVQGFSYGKNASAATVFPGFLSFLDYVLPKGHSVRILSHKSESPIAGPKVDMRKAALESLSREGISQLLANQVENLVPIVFYENREDKVAGILSSNMDIFIDDLIEVAKSVQEVCQSFHIFCRGASNCVREVSCIENWHSMLNKFKELEQNA